MEKKKPHYSLVEIHEAVKTRGVNAFTATSLTGAAALGFSGERASSVCGAGAETCGLIQKHDHTCRPQNLARRISRDIEIWIGGVHQSYLA
jgi:hypothetical protein